MSLAGLNLAEAIMRLELSLSKIPLVPAIVPPTSRGIHTIDPHCPSHIGIKSDLNQGIDRPGSHTNALEHNESSLLIQKLIYLPGTQ